MRKGNNQLTSSCSLGVRDINALLQTAPISRIKTLRDDEGRESNGVFTAFANVGRVIPDNQNNCHAEKSLLSISTTLEKQGGYPEQKHFRMTTNFNEEHLNKDSFKAPIRSGFTLIELLVAILIISILAAVALPQYQVAVEKTKTKRMLAFMHTIDRAQEVYWLGNGKYSESFATLDSSVPASWLVNSSRIQNRLSDCYFWIPNEGRGATSLVCRAIGARGVPEIEKYFGGKSWRCTATNDNTIQTKICKSLANNTSPNKQETKTTYYFTPGEK